MILISGATGLVGRRLVETLISKGHTKIKILTRNKESAEKNFPFPVEIYKWDPTLGTIEQGALDDVQTVFHLAGEGVADGRWSERRKARILNSRVRGTQTLIRSIQESANRPKKFISASAIGIYGDRDHESLSEESHHGSGFLADVCKQWENLAQNHNVEGMSSYSIRIGIVLSSKGGALAKMLPPFKMGGGGRLGNGKQFMSWIHIDDLVGQFIFLMENNANHSTYNGVAPGCVDNNTFTKTLGRVLSRPTIFPVPGIGLKVLFGEMSDILLGSQRVLPKRFEEEGYQFKFKTLESALNDIIKEGEKSLLSKLETAS